MRSLACLLVLVGAQATAADWWMITPASSNPQVVEMGDAASIRTEGRLISIWTHRFYAVPDRRVKSALLHYQVDCDRRATREGRFIDFDASLKTIESGGDSEANNWIDIAPDTVGDRIVTFACASPAYRKQHFIKVRAGQDYRAVASFFLESGELVGLRKKK